MEDPPSIGLPVIHTNLDNSPQARSEAHLPGDSMFRQLDDLINNNHYSDYSIICLWLKTTAHSPIAGMISALLSISSLPCTA